MQRTFIEQTVHSAFYNEQNHIPRKLIKIASNYLCDYILKSITLRLKSPGFLERLIQEEMGYFLLNMSISPQLT